MSFWRLYYHITWSTKDRLPLITEDIESRLYVYLLRKSAEIGAYTYAINGWNDHIHIVAAIPPDISISEFVKILKGASSHYVNYTIQPKPERSFAWQRGFGALSIGEKNRQIAVDYVNDQKRHHMEKTTINGLEFVTEKHIGPDQHGIKSDRSSKSLRESDAEYSLADDMPF